MAFYNSSNKSLSGPNNLSYRHPSKPDWSVRRLNEMSQSDFQDMVNRIKMGRNSLLNEIAILKPDKLYNQAPGRLFAANPATKGVAKAAAKGAGHIDWLSLLDGSEAFYNGYKSLAQSDYYFYLQEPDKLHRHSGFNDVQWEKYGSNFDEAYINYVKYLFKK